MADSGLVPAIKWLDEGIRNFARSEIEIKTGTILPLPQETQLVLFRIVQEVLNNVNMHSGVSKASVVVECQENEVKMIISDNSK